MAERQPLFSPEERRVFLNELWEKYRNGVRSPQGILYLAITLIGIGWASWGIPAINNSEASPETLGIYVIGLLIAVMLDAGIVAWKNNKSISNYELSILVLLTIGALILMCASSFLAIKEVNTTLSPPRREDWRWWATPALLVILMVAIAMSLVVTGMDSNQLNIPAADGSVDIQDRS